MKSRKWMNLVMAVLVAGLFLTVSCSKQPVIEDGSVQPQEQVEKDRDTTRTPQNTQPRSPQGPDAAAMAKKAFLNNDVHFAYDSSELDSDAMALLRLKAKWLRNNPRAFVTVEGHCDERGTTQYNLALGERRASAAKAYLVNLGVPSSQLGTISWGEEKPKAKGRSENAYAQNRRAHFKIN